MLFNPTLFYYIKINMKLNTSIALILLLSISYTCTVEIPFTVGTANKSDDGSLAFLQDQTPINSFATDLPMIYIEVEVGTPPQKVKVLFDSGSTTMWLGKSMYNPSNSRTAINLTKTDPLNYPNHSIQGPYYNDVVKIAGTNLSTKLDFIHSDSDSPQMDGLIGTAAFGSIKESILEKLNSEGKLRKNAFSIRHTKRDSGVLLIGEGYDRPENYIGSCRIPEGFALDYCMVKYIFAGNTQIDINMPLLFDSGTAASYFEKTTFQKLKNALFTELLKDNTCTSTVRDINEYISCKNSALGRLPNISFLLDNRTVILLTPHQYLPRWQNDFNAEWNQRPFIFSQGFQTIIGQNFIQYFGFEIDRSNKKDVKMNFYRNSQMANP